MSDFWTKKNLNSPASPELASEAEAPTMELDPQALAEIEAENYEELVEDDEEDFSSSLSDANFRLEVGRLWQMIITNDIFGETDADPRAIKHVQKIIKKMSKEKMEEMLGMRQAPQAAKEIVSSPFNDMEVTVLKMLASKMSKGATEEVEANEPVAAQSPPKKDGITSISGTTKLKPSAPLKKEVKPIARNKVQSQPVKVKPAILKSDDGPGLTKPIEEMTAEELAAHDKAASERSAKKYATMPTNMVPMPTGAALEMLYTTQAHQISAPGSAVASIMALMNNRKP